MVSPPTATLECASSLYRGSPKQIGYYTEFWRIPREVIEVDLIDPVET